MTFSARRAARADDPNAVFTPICVCNEQESLAYRDATRDEPRFFDGVIRIVECKRKRIKEHGCCLVE
jgi:hypothetical protein